MDRSFQFLDSLRPNAPRFDQHVIDAVEAFLKHSDEEERVLPELIDKLSEEENTVSRVARHPAGFRVERLTCTSFYPGIRDSLETSSGYVLPLSLFACVLDRSADFHSRICTCATNPGANDRPDSPPPGLAPLWWVRAEGIHPARKGRRLDLGGARRQEGVRRTRARARRHHVLICSFSALSCFRNDRHVFAYLSL